MTLDRRRVVKSLTKKGFHEENGKKHILFFYRLDGKETGVFTKVSRGTKYKTLGLGLVKEMAQQCRLSTEQFRSLVRCPLSKEGYRGLIRARIDEEGGPVSHD